MRSSGERPKAARLPLSGVGITANVATPRSHDDRSPTGANDRRERLYNEWRGTTLGGMSGGCSDVGATRGANAATISATWKYAAAAEAGATHVAPCDDDSRASCHSVTGRSAALGAATTGSVDTASERGRFSNLSGRSVPGVVRCGPRPAVLHLRCQCSVCRRRDLLPHTA